VHSEEQLVVQVGYTITTIMFTTANSNIRSFVEAVITKWNMICMLPHHKAYSLHASAISGSTILCDSIVALHIIYIYQIKTFGEWGGEGKAGRARGEGRKEKMYKYNKHQPPSPSPPSLPSFSHTSSYQVHPKYIIKLLGRNTSSMHRI
jgi:hypothetical protein